MRNTAATDMAVVKQKFSLEMKPNRYIQDNMRFNKDVYRVNVGRRSSRWSTLSRRRARTRSAS